MVNKLKNKKGQLKIQQMTFMLLAITIFFVMVGMLVLVIKITSLKSDAAELEEKNALLLVSKIANSPEFSCGKAFGNPKTNCIDADKVMILRENILRYDKFWGIENIEIRKIYPLYTSGEEKICTIGNYPNCNIIKIRPGNISEEHSNFISLCRKDSFEGRVEDRCEIAKLMVSYSEK